MARSIVRPILALSDGALRIATGDAEVVIPGRHRTDEIGVLTRAFHEMTIRLRRNQDELEEQRVEIEDANHRLVAQNRELQRVNEVFEQLSITDDLTKLHNHRFFQEHLPQEMKRAERTGEPISLILVDIDDFKQLNDRHGHSVGDAVLRRVADVMTAEVREMDLLARYGGEEFALLASQTTLEGAAALAEKLRVAVSEARFSLVALDGPAEIRVTVSAGVTTYRGDEKAFFNEADRALYRAKEAGKDCVFVCDDRPSRSDDA
jgi:diguanylate cyclase (GGDEF)-like protein